MEKGMLPLYFDAWQGKKFPAAAVFPEFRLRTWYSSPS